MLRTSQHGAGRWDSGNGALGLSAHSVEGDVPAVKHGSRRLSPCRPRKESSTERGQRQFLST